MTPFAKRCELEALATECVKTQARLNELIASLAADSKLTEIASRMRALAEPEPSESAARPCSCEAAEELKEQLARVATSEAKRLQAELISTTHRTHDLKQERDTARDKYEGLLLALTDAVGSPGCGGGNETGQELVEFLVRARDDARAALKSLPLDLARTTGERDAARAEVDELRKDRDAWVSECQSHVREKSELATQLEQARRDIQTKNDAFQCAVAAKDSAHQALRQREKDELAALAELDESRAAVERLKQALHSANTDLERLRAERSHLDRIRELESKVESLLDERAVHIDTIDDLTEERNRLSGRLRTTEEERSHAVILGRQADDYSRHARGEVERLKQALSAARDALPTWAVPITKPVVMWHPNRNYIEDLTPDQRRQCLGET